MSPLIPVQFIKGNTAPALESGEKRERREKEKARRQPKKCLEQYQAKRNDMAKRRSITPLQKRPLYNLLRMQKNTKSLQNTKLFTQIQIDNYSQILSRFLDTK